MTLVKPSVKGAPLNLSEFEGNYDHFLGLLDGKVGTGDASVTNARAIANADYGDFTVASGTATIDNNVITNAKLADMATATIKGRSTAGTGDPEDITADAALTIILNALLARSASAQRAFHTSTKGLALAEGETPTDDAFLQFEGSGGEVKVAAGVPASPATPTQLAGGTTDGLVVSSVVGSLEGEHTGTVVSGNLDIDLTADAYINWKASISAALDVSIVDFPDAWAGKRLLKVRVINSAGGTYAVTVSSSAEVDIVQRTGLGSFALAAAIGAELVLIFDLAAPGFAKLIAAYATAAP